MEIKAIKEFIYSGTNNENRIIIMKFSIGKNSIQLRLTYKDRKFIVILGTNLLDRYELIKRINRVIETKESQNLVLKFAKNTNEHYRNFPTYLLFDNNNYYITIDINSSIYYFYIPSIEEVLLSLKEGLIQPGDKFIGLEAIEPINYNGYHVIWKTRCLLCNRIIKRNQDVLKKAKSCGCLGNRHFTSNKDRFFSYVDKQENVPKEQQIRGTLGLDEEPCWLWKGYKNKKHYGRFFIKNKRKFSHRYNWEIYNKEKLTDSNIFICHRCDNPSCVNPSHLFKGTNLDKVKDRERKGRNHVNSKLTEKQILEIRSEKVLTRKEMANKYKVSYGYVNTILSKRSWKHLL